MSFDFLNRNRERNTENTSSLDYNCGGYALQTYSWFRPYESSEDRDEYILDMYNAGYTFQEIKAQLLNSDLEFMLKTFEGALRLITSISEATGHEDIIAYRIGIEEKALIEDGWVNDDFHFRVYRDGYWSEKAGSCPIIPSKEPNAQETWGEREYDDLVYDSTILFFAFDQSKITA